MSDEMIIYTAIPEGTTRYFEAIIRDSNGNPIPGTALLSLTLTYHLKDKPSRIVNSRNKQDVLGKNGVTVDEQGALVWRLDPPDTTILDDARRPTTELHVALFEWTYSSPTEYGKQRFGFEIQNWDRVP